jgi:DNA-binding CsgD family transcriptional regulator
MEHLRQEDGIARTRTDLVRDKEFEASAECQYGRVMGVGHQMVCLHSLRAAKDVLGGFWLWRAAGELDFGPRDRVLVGEAIAAIAPLIGAPLARGSDPSPSGLAPRVRQVLRRLLEGDGDKQIAARRRLTRYTVNEYAKTIFRHFEVQSRPELLARWVRRGFPTRFSWEDEQG